MRLSSVKKKGKLLEFSEKGKTARARVLKETRITIAGKKAKGAALKTGMHCAVTYEGHMTAARTIACK